MKAKFSEQQQYNDVPFAVGFMAQISGVFLWIGYAAATGQYHVVHAAADPEVVMFLLQGGRRMLGGDGSGDTNQAAFAMLLVFASLALALMWAVLWMILLQVCPAQIVEASLLALPAMSLVMVLICLAQGNVFGACVFSALTAVAALYVWYVWDRVDFTAKLFKSVSTIYSQSRGIFLVAFAVTALQTAWMFVWLLAVAPFYIAKNSSGLSIIACLVLLLSVFWTSQVISNVLHVSCSGVVARWYYNEQVDDAVSKSTKQALTICFGSICLGSLLIALIQTTRALCEMAKDSAKDSESPVAYVCLAIVDCILGYIEYLAQVFTAYTFAYIAICAMPFHQAGEAVWELMKDSDAEPLVNSGMVNGVSTFGSLAGAVFTCALTALLAWRVGLESHFIVGAALLGFVAGFAVMSVVSRIFEAGCTTLFVAFAESPTALAGLDGGSLVPLFAERKKLQPAKQ